MPGAGPAFVPNGSGLSCLHCTLLRHLTLAVFVHTGILPTTRAPTKQMQTRIAVNMYGRTPGQKAVGWEFSLEAER